MSRNRSKSLLRSATLFATATEWLNDSLEVVCTVVIGQLLAGSDLFFSIDKNTSFIFVEFWFAVWFAAVVDVTSDVFSAGTVDGPVVVEFEEVFATAPLCFVIADSFASVFDHEVTLLKRRGGK